MSLILPKLPFILYQIWLKLPLWYQMFLFVNMLNFFFFQNVNVHWPFISLGLLEAVVTFA